MVEDKYLEQYIKELDKLDINSPYSKTAIFQFHGIYRVITDEVGYSINNLTTYNMDLINKFIKLYKKKSDDINNIIFSEMHRDVEIINNLLNIMPKGETDKMDKATQEMIDLKDTPSLVKYLNDYKILEKVTEIDLQPYDEDEKIDRAKLIVNNILYKANDDVRLVDGKQMRVLSKQAFTRYRDEIIRCKTTKDLIGWIETKLSHNMYDRSKQKENKKSE